MEMTSISMTTINAIWVAGDCEFKEADEIQLECPIQCHNVAFKENIAKVAEAKTPTENEDRPRKAMSIQLISSEIFRHVTIKDLLNFSLVNRTWNSMCRQELRQNRNCAAVINSDQPCLDLFKLNNVIRNSWDIPYSTLKFCRKKYTSVSANLSPCFARNSSSVHDDHYNLSLSKINCKLSSGSWKHSGLNPVSLKASRNCSGCPLSRIRVVGDGKCPLFNKGLPFRSNRSVMRCLPSCPYFSKNVRILKNLISASAKKSMDWCTADP